jgi:site-specific recombinase XerD
MSNLDALRQVADDLGVTTRAASTMRVYQTDVRLFREWCAEHDLRALPATTDTVRLYVTHLAHVENRAATTIAKKMSGISQWLTDAGHPGKAIVWNPQVTAVLAGIKRRQATEGRRTRRKTPLRTRDVRAIGEAMGDRSQPQAARDWALILIQYAGAFRRSEVAALNVEDIRVVDGGLEVNLRRSKTDQEAIGSIRGIPRGDSPDTCPVAAWQSWLSHYGATEGPAFPSMDQWGHLKRTADGQPKHMDGRSVAELVKRRAVAAGLPGDWGGNSARRGFATEATVNDASDLSVMRHGRWNWARTMHTYAEDPGDPWTNNPARKLGL